MLQSPSAWDALGLAEGAHYFATVAMFGDEPWEALADEVDGVLGACPDVRAAGGALARRGFIVRCLALNAGALGEAVERLWSAARRRLLGYSPLALRKL